ncbi:MAG: ATP synthase F0 subunit C [Acidobacteriota bacterium]
MKRILFLTTSISLGLLALAAPAFAGGGTQYDQGGMGLLAAALAVGISGGLCGLGQGKAVVGACEGTARNPGAAADIFKLAIVGLAFIESLTIYGLVIAFILQGKVPAAS